MILLIDNYDSFTFNLYQMVGALDPAITVVRNDRLSVQEVERLAPSHIIISPGPGRPEDAGICPDLIRRFAGRIPLLGVCLGHQAICQVFGATITYAQTLMHGKASLLEVDTQTTLFAGLPPTLQGARYHSLVAAPDTIPAALRVTARSTRGEVMAVQHRDYPLYGVQFHPESILTPHGAAIVGNFLAVSPPSSARGAPINCKIRENRAKRIAIRERDLNVFGFNRCFPDERSIT